MFYGQRLFNFSSCANPLAGIVTYPPADSWKRMVFFKQFQRLTIFAVVHEGNKTLNTHMRRTGSPAWGRSPFGNCKCSGYCLGVLFVYRLSLRKAFVISIGYVYGTNLDAISAAGALVKIDISRMLHNAGSIMSWGTFNPQ
jgi:hypothetical protein